ncbi:hypothetical protein B0G82_7273 [Paraburkholderia sp. BL17N1]|nr:hypothetical protein B0G82_7273 [Paraburkholderia sp. BL17N1]
MPIRRDIKVSTRARSGPRLLARAGDRFITSYVFGPSQPATTARTVSTACVLYQNFSIALGVRGGWSTRRSGQHCTAPISASARSISSPSNQPRPPDFSGATGVGEGLFLSVTSMRFFFCLGLPGLLLLVGSTLRRRPSTCVCDYRWQVVAAACIDWEPIRIGADDGCWPVQLAHRIHGTSWILTRGGTSVRARSRSRCVQQVSLRPCLQTELLHRRECAQRHVRAGVNNIVDAVSTAGAVWRAAAGHSS